MFPTVIPEHKVGSEMSPIDPPEVIVGTKIVLVTVSEQLFLVTLTLTETCPVIVSDGTV